jgi:hypothetical protein
MSQPELKVVTLYESNFQDPVATLRKLASDIEAGEYGDVASLGVVLAGDELCIFGMGKESQAATVASLLHEGCLRLNESAWPRR